MKSATRFLAQKEFSKDSFSLISKFVTDTIY